MCDVCVSGGLLLAGEREGGRGGYLHIIKVGKGSVMRRECVCVGCMCVLGVVLMGWVECV